MAYTGKASDIVTDEQIGAFSGYVRRPTPSQSGMLAVIFGEDGPDADTIVPLGITRYQDSQVFVNVYLVKDPNGKIMKQGDSYPLISSFVGFVRRPRPSPGGLLAEFFAPNGVHADEISNLSKSEYQDCLVFVDIRGALASKKVAQVEKENTVTIETNYIHKITKQQRVEFNKLEKLYKRMNEQILMSEFLYKVEVATSLGDSEKFKEWLTDHRTCCHAQEKECLNHSNVVEMPLLFKPFNYLPACEAHKEDFRSEAHLEEHRYYYEYKHRLLIKEWTWNIMKEKFSYDGKSEPDPSKVIEWATNNKVAKFLPTKYAAIL